MPRYRLRAEHKRTVWLTADIELEAVSPEQAVVAAEMSNSRAEVRWRSMDGMPPPETTYTVLEEVA